MNYPDIGQIAMAAGLILFLLGLWGIITQKNILRIIIAFTLQDAGINIVLVSIGFLRNRTAPIVDQALPATQTLEKAVDPVPQALVLTAIVIGVGITALMLTYALQLYRKTGSLDINKFNSLKW